MSYAGTVLDMINRVKANRSMQRSGRRFRDKEHKYSADAYGEKYVFKKPTLEELVANRSRRKDFLKKRRRHYLAVGIICGLLFVVGVLYIFKMLFS